MGIEDKIRYELHQGAKPADLIKKGFRKSTVYKVQQTIRSFGKKISPPEWEIRYIHFDKYDSYKAGEAVKMNFDLYNKSHTKILYVKNVGIQTEWMEKDGMWYSQKLNDIVRPWTSKRVFMSFPIPEETNPGKSRMSFVVEGEFIKDETPVMTQVSSTPLVISN